MFDNGNHVVLRRDGVAVVLKTPQNEMPQVDVRHVAGRTAEHLC